jgi:hypothetical protein
MSNYVRFPCGCARRQNRPGSGQITANRRALLSGIVFARHGDSHDTRPAHCENNKAPQGMPTEYHLGSKALQARISHLIDEGELPAVIAKTIHAGYGSEHKCHACGRSITTEQLEYEVLVPKRLRLHLGCYVLWQIDCLERAGKRR